jgi:hypothetical protein
LTGRGGGGSADWANRLQQGAPGQQWQWLQPAGTDLHRR